MKKYFSLIGIIQYLLTTSLYANEPDSVCIFSYSIEKSDNHSGLPYTRNIDKQNCHPIDLEFQFLISDLGSCKVEMKKLTPFLFKDNNAISHCVWLLNKYIGVSHAVSKHLYTWVTQSYPHVMKKGNFVASVIYFNQENKFNVITSLSEYEAVKYLSKTRVVDFNTFTATEECSEKCLLNSYVQALILECTIINYNTNSNS